MIQSFMHYFVNSSKSSILTENIQSFNDRCNDVTGTEFRQFIADIHDPRHSFLKIMKYDHNAFTICNVRNEFGYVNGGVMIEYSEERADEIPVQNFIDDFTAIVDHDYSLDVPMKCFSTHQQNTVQNFMSIYDTDSNVVFAVVNAPSYDMAEDDISNCMNFVNSCIGSKKLDDLSLANAVTALMNDQMEEDIDDPQHTALKHMMKFFSASYLQSHPNLRQQLHDFLNNDQENQDQQQLPPPEDQQQQDEEPPAEQQDQQQQDQQQDEEPPAEQQDQQQDENQYRTLTNGIRYAGVWTNTIARDDSYNIILARAQTEQEFITYMQSLNNDAAQCFATKPVRFKHIDFNSQNTLIKRLSIIMFDRQNAMTFYTSTNTHPMVLRVNASQRLFDQLNTIQADVWHKYFWKEWRTAFDKLQAGVMVLWDRDSYFNRKHGLQATCPFAIGKQVNGPGRVSDEGSNGDAQQNAQQNADGEQQPRQPQQRQRQTDQNVINTVNAAVKDSLRQSGDDDIEIELAVNRGHRPRGCPRDNNQYFVVKFPGMLDDVYVGDQAIEFLQDLDLWSGVLQPGFDIAAQQFENIKPCVTLHNPLT